jgi:acyl carrier protein
MSVPQFTHADLKTILVERIGLAEAAVPSDPETAFAALGLDSLAVVEIQLAVQQQWAFTIPDEDAGLMTTVGEAIAYVNARLAAKELV